VVVVVVVMMRCLTLFIRDTTASNK
jgi:hypothetical protein